MSDGLDDIQFADEQRAALDALIKFETLVKGNDYTIKHKGKVESSYLAFAQLVSPLLLKLSDESSKDFWREKYENVVVERNKYIQQYILSEYMRTNRDADPGASKLADSPLRL